MNLGVKRYGIATIRYVSRYRSHDTTAIRYISYMLFLKIYLVFFNINLKQIKYFIQKRYVSSSIFLYHDTYLDDCTTIYRGAWCVVSPFYIRHKTVYVLTYPCYSLRYTSSVCACLSLLQSQVHKQCMCLLIPATVSGTQAVYVLAYPCYSLKYTSSVCAYLSPLQSQVHKQCMCLLIPATVSGTQAVYVLAYPRYSLRYTML